jgi:hypothetical protein
VQVTATPTEHSPPVELADADVTPIGKVKVATAPEAPSGPPFETVNVNTTFSPTSGATFELLIATLRSAALGGAGGTVTGGFGLGLGFGHTRTRVFFPFTIRVW